MVKRNGGSAPSSRGGGGRGGAEPQPKKTRKAERCCGLCGALASPAPGWPGTGEAEDRVVVCKRCDEFCSESWLDVQDTIKKKEKDPAFAKTLDEDLQEFTDNRDDPSRRQFAAAEVRFELDVDSKLEEPYEFISRANFKQMFGVMPDECKLSQTKVLNKKGQEEVGICRQTEQHPTLVVSTSKRYVKSEVAFPADRHLYKRQIDRVWAGLTAQHAQNMGQEVGDKYVGKKSVQVYSDAELEAAVESHKRKHEQQHLRRSRSGLLSLGAEAEVTEESSKAARLEAESLSAGLERPSTTHASDRAAASSSKNLLAIKDKDLPSPDATSKDSESPSGVGDSLSGGSDKEGSVASVPSSASALADEQGRTKTASYWLNVLEVGKILSGKSMERELRFARACVPRTARAGDDIMVWDLAATLSVLPCSGCSREAKWMHVVTL